MFNLILILGARIKDNNNRTRKYFQNGCFIQFFSFIVSS